MADLMSDELTAVRARLGWRPGGSPDQRCAVAGYDGSSASGAALAYGAEQAARDVLFRLPTVQVGVIEQCATHYIVAAAGHALGHGAARTFQPLFGGVAVVQHCGWCEAAAC